MWNCMKKQPAIQSTGGDWGSPATSPEKELFSGDHRDDSRRGDKYGEKTVTTAVKIKISKKKLEELLGSTDVQGLTVEQVLARLVKAGERVELDQRSWRPALRSIPE